MHIETDHYPFDITDDISNLDEQHGINETVREIIANFFPDIGKGKKSTIKRLERTIKKYPNVPQFRNYLSKEYLALGREKKSRQVNDELLELHPGYLFARVNKAHELMDQDKPEEVTYWLGEDLELHTLYHERSEFHIQEVLNYYSTTVMYFLKVDQPDDAKSRLDTLLELDPEAGPVKMAMRELMLYNINKNQKIYNQDKKNEKKVEGKGHRKSTQTDQKPGFRHQEIEILYSRNIYDLSLTKIESLLALPKTSLVQDLEYVLEDAINRFEFFRDEVQKYGWDENKYDFPIHAVCMLAELKSKQSLPAILEFLRQGDEFHEFWFGDRLEEFITGPFAELAKGQTELLDQFVREPDIDAYSKNIAVTAAERLARLYPEQKENIINMFGEWISYFLNHKEDERLIDTALLGFITWSCLNLKAENLLDLIKKLYEKNLVPIQMLGSFEDVERDIRLEDHSPDVKPYSIFSHYERIRNNTLYKPAESKSPSANPPLPSFDSLDDSGFEPAVNPLKDVGRNDPCPCGSGKKYKKCCL